MTSFGKEGCTSRTASPVPKGKVAVGGLPKQQGSAPFSYGVHPKNPEGEEASAVPYNESDASGSQSDASARAKKRLAKVDTARVFYWFRNFFRI